VAATAMLAGPIEIAVVGDPAKQDFVTMWHAALMATSPGVVVAAGAWGSDSDGVPLLRDRSALDGRATAYVCRGFVCQRPTVDPADLALRVGARQAPSGE
jgi:uncharacterized protein YyaL (SSP411 family)